MNMQKTLSDVSSQNQKEISLLINSGFVYGR